MINVKLAAFVFQTIIVSLVAGNLAIMNQRISQSDLHPHINYQRLWPNKTVPYKSLLSEINGIRNLNLAIKHIHSKTCVRFVPYNEKIHKEIGYVIIYSSRGSCNATVGRWGRTGSTVHLDPLFCTTMGTIMHELMHVLGFHHEHSRPDRDNYVRLNFKKIQQYDSRNLNFKKFDWNSFAISTPYDYSSIMHYGSESFAKKRGQKTLLPKLAVKIGQRKHLSYWDAYKVNILYKCDIELGKKCRDIRERHVCIALGLAERKCQDEKWSKENCRETCGHCVDVKESCEDLSPACMLWARQQKCEENIFNTPGLIKRRKEVCPKSCNSCK